MKYENFFKDLFESVPDYRKLAILMFLIKNDEGLFLECGFFKNHINRLNKEFKNILIEQKEQNLDHNKNQEVSIIHKFLNK